MSIIPRISLLSVTPALTLPQVRYGLRLLLLTNGISLRSSI